MPRAKAIAIAAIQDNPFTLAFESARNSMHAAVDFMYGTPERSRITYIFAIGMFILGEVLNSSAASAAQFCSL